MSGHPEDPPLDDELRVPSWADRILDDAGQQQVAVPSTPIESAITTDQTLSLPVVPASADGYTYGHGFQLHTDQTTQVRSSQDQVASPPMASGPPSAASGAHPAQVTLREPGEPTSSGLGRAVREWVPVLLVAVVVALAIRLLVIQAYHIPSLSMAPTLDEGDRVIVNRLSGDVDRGEVVVFAKPPNQVSEADDLIKRVIGLPGETVQLRDGNVYVDRQLVQEDHYIAQPQSSRPRQPVGIPGCAQDVPSPDTCTVPEGYVFVMGDNRLGSQDSRVFGPIAIDTIVGRAFVKVWPLDAISWL